MLLGTLAEKRFEDITARIVGGKVLRIEDHRPSRSDPTPGIISRMQTDSSQRLWKVTRSIGPDRRSLLPIDHVSIRARSNERAIPCRTCWLHLSITSFNPRPLK